MCNSIVQKYDAFMARDDVRRFNEVATSVLLSAGKVALAALAIIGSIAFFGGAVGGLVACGFAFAHGDIASGIEFIIASIAMGAFAVTFAGTVLPAAIMSAVQQCKETHRVIWEN